MGSPPRRSRSPVRPVILIAVPWSDVHTLDARAYLVPFASSIASASVENDCNGDNRPEYLFLDQLIFLLHPGNNSWQIEKPWSSWLSPANTYVRICGASLY